MYYMDQCPSLRMMMSVPVYDFILASFNKLIFLYSYRALLKGAIIVIPVLGCTWVFGLLAINENTVGFAWIFTILNSLQVM